jgi:tetratricopeptide (TPR) repeat protein
MPTQGKGEKSWQRVSYLVEALIDYALNDTNRISYLRADWKGDTTELTVSATLEALRHLLKDRGSFKPNKTTSDLQVRKYIGEVLTDYLGKKLKILTDNRPETARRGTSNWNFTLNLWSRDKTENLQKLAEAWGVNGEPGISSQSNSGQNTDGKSENDDVPADAPPDKAIKVAFSQLPDSIPVWKGRDELVESLTAKLVQMLPDGTSPPKVLAIIGQGGMGKTSLAVKLAEALGVNWQKSVFQKGESLPGGDYECAMYFEAKERMSFDDVAGFLLSEGLGIQAAEVLKTAEEKIAKIMAGLQQTRCLLVFDNLESILHPAVEAGNPDILAAAQVHRAISPDWGKLLNGLVYQQHQSQTILTSREVPADLAHTRYPGLAPDSELVHIEMLEGVDLAAGVEILQQRKLSDTLADLQWISQRVEGHVFLLTQLAALGKGKPGFLRKHPELVTKNAEPMLREQLTRQSAAARDLLRRMCVLRVPIDVKGLTFLRLYTDDVYKDIRFELAAILAAPAEFTEAEISDTAAILDRLVGASLVQSRYDEDKCEEFYDLHRVIEEFLQGEYKDELPKLLESVYKFYCTGKTVDNPQSLADLQAVLEAQHFAFKLGNYREAYSLIVYNLNEALKRWGYWTLLQELYEKILPHVKGGERSYSLISLGAIHRDFGNWDLAEKYFKDALAIAEEENNKREIATSLGMLGDIERNRGNWDEAEKLFRQCLEMMTELGDRSGMASSWGVLGDIERNRGNWDEAEKLYRQSLALTTEVGDRSGMASSWRVLGYIEQCRGNWDQAEKLYRQSLALTTELGDRSGMASSWTSLGDIEQCRGNWDEAEKLYRQSLALRTELGDREGIASSWASLGDIERNRGNWDEAEKLYRQSLALRTELGERSGMAYSWASLGDIERNRGNWDEAEKLYGQSLELRTELGDRSNMAYSWASLGDIERNRGNWDEAEKLYRQSLEMMTELGDREGMASSWASLGNIERNRGNWDEAEKLYRQSLELRTELGDREGMATSIGCLGENELGRGNLDTAEQLLTEALGKMQILGMTWSIAETNYDLARLERKRGNTELAQQHYDTAHQIFQQLGAAKDLEKIDREWHSTD